MRKLIFCCLSLLLFMACGGRTHDITGEWNMEFVDNGISAYSVVLADDTVCVSALDFKKDTIYMQVKSDGKVVKSEFVGKYVIDDNRLVITNRYGEKKRCEFVIEKNIMIVREKDNPTEIIMRLQRATSKG